MTDKGKHIVVLSGAGVSAESGLKTFRDANGLWEGHDVMQVASPQGWAADKSLVLKFYNDRRRQLLQCKPNEAHFGLAQLEDQHKVSIITQNVDDLHERAGSTKVLHLHGELRKVRSTFNPETVLPWDGDLNLGDTCPEGGQLRPHIVWFGEPVPLIEEAAYITSTADILIVVGTSLQVYPAAGLIDFSPKRTPIYYIDPQPYISRELNQRSNLFTVPMNATKGIHKVLEALAF